MNRRGLILILLVFGALTARAQWPVDSAKRKVFSELDTKYKDALIVVDGVPSNAAQISENKVFDIIAIDKGKLTGLYTEASQHDLIVVTTKAAVKIHYQKTLSALSLDYRNYLDTNHNDDSNLQYILNSQALKSGSEEQLDRLYKLSPEKITNVSLTTVKGKKTLIIDINFDE